MLLLGHEQNEKVPPRQRGRRTPYEANAVVPIPGGSSYERFRSGSVEMRYLSLFEVKVVSRHPVTASGCSVV